MHSTLQRYVLNDAVKTLVLAFVVLSLLFFLGTGLRVVREFKDLDLEVLAQVVPTLLATSLALTLPLSVLAGCTLTFSRLAHDNEITAMRACGVHLHRIVGPVLGMAGLVALAAFVLGNTIVPDSYWKSRKLAALAVDAVMSAAISDDPRTIDYFPGYLLHFTGVDAQKRLKNLVLHRIDKGLLAEEILARTGELQFTGRQARLVLEDGSLAFVRSQYKPGVGREGAVRPKPLDPRSKKLNTAKRGQNETGNWVDFELAFYDRTTHWAKFDHYELVLEIPEIDTTEFRERPKHLRLPVLVGRIAELSGDIDHARRELAGVHKDWDEYKRVIQALETGDVTLAPILEAEAAALDALVTACRSELATRPDEERRHVLAYEIWSKTEHAKLKREMAGAIARRESWNADAFRQRTERFPPDIDFREKLITRRERDVRKMETEHHKRYSLPLACLVVVLLGVPLGLLVRHSNKLVAFGISAVPVFGVYYPLMMVGESLSEAGRLPPLLAMQLPNLVLGAIGLGLLRHVYRQ